MVDASVIIAAIYNGDVETVERSIESGFDIDAPLIEGATALHLAAEHGQESICELALEHGAQVDKRDERGDMAIHTASTFGHALIVRRLLAVKNMTNERDATGGTPLHRAAGGVGGAVCCILELISSGAATDASDKEGDTPLHNAANFSNVAGAYILLRHGAPCAAVNRRNKTPIDEARAIISELMKLDPAEAAFQLAAAKDILLLMEQANLGQLS